MSPTTTLSLLQGTADLLILRALRAAPPMQPLSWVRERTTGYHRDAALMALHRLEARG